MPVQAATSDYDDSRSRSTLPPGQHGSTHRPRPSYDDSALYDPRRGTGGGYDGTSASLPRRRRHPSPTGYASTLKIVRKPSPGFGDSGSRDDSELATATLPGWSTKPRTMRRVTRIVSRGPAAAELAKAAPQQPRLVFRDRPPDPQRFTVSIPEPVAAAPPPPTPLSAPLATKQNSPPVQAVQYIQRFDTVVHSRDATLSTPPTPGEIYRLPTAVTERQPSGRYVAYDGVQESSTNRTRGFVGAHPAAAAASADPVAHRNADESDLYRSELVSVTEQLNGSVDAPHSPPQPQSNAGDRRTFVSKIFQQEHDDLATPATTPASPSRVYVQGKSGVAQSDEPPRASPAPPAAVDRFVTTIVQTADLPIRPQSPPSAAVTAQPFAREKSVIFLSQSGDDSAARYAPAAAQPRPERNDGPRVGEGGSGDSYDHGRLRRDISVVESVLAALTRTYDAEERYPGAWDDDPALASPDRPSGRPDAAQATPAGREEEMDSSVDVIRHSRSIVDERLSSTSSVITHRDRRAPTPRRGEDDDEGAEPRELDRYGSGDGNDVDDDLDSSWPQHREDAHPSLNGQRSPPLVIRGHRHRAASRLAQSPSAAGTFAADRSPVRTGRGPSSLERSLATAVQSPANARERQLDERPERNARQRSTARQMQPPHSRAEAGVADSGRLPGESLSSPPQPHEKDPSWLRSDNKSPPTAKVSPPSQLGRAAVPSAAATQQRGKHTSPQRRGTRPPADGNRILAPTNGDSLTDAQEKPEPRQLTMAAARKSTPSPPRPPSQGKARGATTGGGSPIDSRASTKRPPPVNADELKPSAPIDRLAENVHEFMDAYDEMQSQSSQRPPDAAIEDADASRRALNTHAGQRRSSTPPTAIDDAQEAPVDEATATKPASSPERPRFSVSDLDDPEVYDSDDDEALWASVESQIIPDTAKEALQRTPVRRTAAKKPTPGVAATPAATAPPASAPAAPTRSRSPPAGHAGRRTPPVDEGSQQQARPPLTSATRTIPRNDPETAARDGRAAAVGSSVRPAEGGTRAASPRRGPAFFSPAKSEGSWGQPKHGSLAYKGTQTERWLADAPASGGAIEDGERRTGDSDRLERGRPSERRPPELRSTINDKTPLFDSVAAQTREASSQTLKSDHEKKLLDDLTGKLEARDSEQRRNRSPSDPQADVSICSRGTQTSDTIARPTDDHQISQASNFNYSPLKVNGVTVPTKLGRSQTPYSGHVEKTVDDVVDQQKVGGVEQLRQPSTVDAKRDAEITMHGTPSSNNLAGGDSLGQPKSRPVGGSSLQPQLHAPCEDLMPVEDVTEVATQTDFRQYPNRGVGKIRDTARGEEEIGMAKGQTESQLAPVRLGSQYTSHEEPMRIGGFQTQNSFLGNHATRRPEDLGTSRREQVRSDNRNRLDTSDLSAGHDHRDGDGVDGSTNGDRKPERHGQTESSNGLGKSGREPSLVAVDNAFYETALGANGRLLLDGRDAELKRKKQADGATSRTLRQEPRDGLSETPEDEEERQALEAFRDMPSENKEVFQQLTRTAFERTQARSEAFFAQHGGGLITEAYHNSLPQSDAARMLEELRMTENETISDMQTEVGRIRNKRKLEEVRKRRIEFEAYIKHQEKVKALKEGIRQRVHVDHDEHVIHGDYEMTTTGNGAIGVDTVEEHVDLGINDLGVAAIAVRVTAVRILPFEPENGKWRRSSVSVTRTIEIDLLCCEDTRALYVALKRAHNMPSEGGRRSPSRPAEMDSAETYRVFSALMSVTGDSGGADLMLLGSQAERHYLAAPSGSSDSPVSPLREAAPLRDTDSASASGSEFLPATPRTGLAFSSPSTSLSTSVTAETRTKAFADCGKQQGTAPMMAITAALAAGDGDAAWRATAPAGRTEAAAAAAVGATSLPPPYVDPISSGTLQPDERSDSRSLVAAEIGNSSSFGHAGDTGLPQPKQQLDGASSYLKIVHDAGEPLSAALRAPATAAIAGRELATNGHSGGAVNAEPRERGSIATALSTAGSAARIASGPLVAEGERPAFAVDFGGEREQTSPFRSHSLSHGRASLAHTLQQQPAQPRAITDAPDLARSVDKGVRSGSNGAFRSPPLVDDKAAAATAAGIEPDGFAQSQTSSDFLASEGSEMSLRRKYGGSPFVSADLKLSIGTGDTGCDDVDAAPDGHQRYERLFKQRNSSVTVVGGEAITPSGESSQRYDHSTSRRRIRFGSQLSRTISGGDGSGSGGAETAKTDGRRAGSTASAGRLGAAIAGISHCDTPTLAEDYERVRLRHRDILADMQRMRIAPLTAGDGGATALESSAFRRSLTGVSDSSL